MNIIKKVPIITANSLSVETGRDCPRKCPHCLRGLAEKVAINMEYAKAFLSQFSCIYSITFTGGEPTLYAEQISELIDFIIDKKIEVHGFYIASNGEIYSHELMSSLIKFYAYIMQYSDNELTAYDVSSDQFHEPKKEVIRKLQAFSFFQQRSIIPQTGILAEGYAAENGIGYRHLDYNKKFYVNVCEYADGRTEYEVETIYLNALGYIYADCDYSYETQRKIATHHCMDKRVSEILSDEKYSDIYE